MSRHLDRALEEAFGQPVRAVRRQSSDYSSSFATERLEVTFRDGTVANVLFKNLDRGAILDAARRLKPAFLYDPRREINVYLHLHPALSLGAPKLYGVSGNWLFLEFVSASELCEIGDFEAWLEAARWLARLHAAPVSESASARAAVPELLEHDGAYYERWLARARAFAGPRLDEIAGACRAAVQVLAASPRTLLHGEFYPSNILVAEQEHGMRICPVDWEMAAIGPSILDVAALTSGAWSRQERLAMLDVYCAALPERLRPSDPTLAFDCARLQIALQWLGWSENWSPDHRHAHDWLAEALEAAHTLAGPAPCCHP